MLEIVIVYFLCKGVGDILRKKNRAPLPLQIMTAVLWVGGEIAGGVVWGVMTALSGKQAQEFDFTLYLFALVGAGLGAGFSFLVAFLIPAKQPPQPAYNPYGYAPPGGNFTGPAGDPTNPYAPPQAPQNPFGERR